jgi:AraC family transcriptional regulator
MRARSADPVSYGTRRSHSVVAGPFLVTDAWFGGKDVLPPHHHDRTVVGVTLSGEWSSVIDRRTLVNRAGVVHTEPAGDTHSNHFAAGGTHVLIVQPDPEARELLEPCRQLLTEVHRVVPDGARAVAGRLIAELACPDDLSPMAIEAACLDLLTCALRAGRERLRQHPPWLARVVEYLQAEFRRAPALTEVAAVAGVHPSHLLRAFKEAFGETPFSRIRRLRLEWAASEMTGQDTPLIDIAAAAGFADQSHFTREFRRYFRVTPAAYRRGESPADREVQKLRLQRSSLRPSFRVGPC